MSKDTGGPAFPVHGGYEGDDPRNQILGGGATLHNYFAAKAPITFEVAREVWGCCHGQDVGLSCDKTRKAFMAVWAMLCNDWADAMLDDLAERAK